MVQDGEDVEMDNLREDGRDAEAEEPLIANDHADTGQNHSGRQHAQVKTPLHRAGRVVWILTLSAGISGLLFGYDTGVISSTLVSIGSDLSHRPLTTADKSVITAVTSFFALLSSPCTGYLADKFGRLRVILFANLLFILGAVVQAVATYVPVMVAGRAAVGAAVGLASCATPLYITEVAPPEIRGRLVVIQSLFVTGGQVVAYVIGWAFAHLTGGWRWMVGLGAAPALVQLVLLFTMYETPRHLIRTGHVGRAEAVLQAVYSGLTGEQKRCTIESVMLDIKTEVAAEAKLDEEDNGDTGPSFSTTVRHLFLEPGNRRALTIACMLQAIQQLCGFNSLMYFSATIFSILDFDNPIATSLLIALTNFVFTVAAFAFIDSIGRRRILLFSIPAMVIALAACSIAFLHSTILGDRLLIPKDHPIWPSAILVAMLIYVASYAIGIGCVPWQQSELFPLRVRSLGSGLATATNWSSNFVIGISFLPMMQYLSPSVTFAAYALICLAGWLGVWKIYPETAGLELEGIGSLLKDGWGVRGSVEGFRERRRAGAG